MSRKCAFKSLTFNPTYRLVCEPRPTIFCDFFFSKTARKGMKHACAQIRNVVTHRSHRGLQEQIQWEQRQLFAEQASANDQN